MTAIDCNNTSSAAFASNGSCTHVAAHHSCAAAAPPGPAPDAPAAYGPSCTTQVLRIDISCLPTAADADWSPHIYTLPGASDSSGWTSTPPTQAHGPDGAGACTNQQLTASTAADVSPLLSPSWAAASAAVAAPQPAAAAGSQAAAPALAPEVPGLQALHYAAQLLRQGLPVAMPTETVYGLAADATNTSAVASIFQAKGRPSDNPLIVHVSDMAMLASLYPQQGPQATFLPDAYASLIDRFWPGPLTLLLPASPAISPAVSAGRDTIAVRMPAHPVARALVAAAGVPLAAPSANLSGRPSPTLAEHVLHDLGGRIPLVLDGGGCECGVESTVLDGLRSPPAILRPGGVTAEQLACSCPAMSGLQVYSVDFSSAELEAAPTTPGMKYAHYSPSVPLLLLEPQPGPAGRQGAVQAAAGRAAVAARGDSGAGPQGEAGSSCSAAAAADGCGLEQGGAGVGSGSTGGALRTALRAASEALVAQLHAQGHQVVGLLRTSVGSRQAPGWVQAPGSCSLVGGQHQRSGQHALLEYCLGSCEEPAVVARHLFAGMRALDDAGVGVIVVEGVAQAGEGLAVMNRLRKAAAQVLPVTLEASTLPVIP